MRYDGLERVPLYLYAKEDYSLKKYGDLFRLFRGEEQIQKIPAIKVNEILVFGGLTLTSPVIQLCQKHKINIHFLSGSGQYHGSLIFDPAKNLFIRKAQAEIHLDDKRRLEFAKEFVLGKITNQKWVLDSFRKKHRFNPNIDWNKIESLDSLRGVEGTYSRLYFQELAKQLKNTDFSFNGRSKRPPADPVNALLSLGYTFLFSRLFSYTTLIGLDPYLGFFHENYYGRPSLVCDLMEPWRPLLVDKFILTILNRNELSLEDFERVDDSIKLNSEGFKKFIQKWYTNFEVDNHTSGRFETELTYQKALELDTRLFGKSLTQEIEAYKAYTRP